MRIKSWNLGRSRDAKRVDIEEGLREKTDILLLQKPYQYLRKF